MIDISQKKAVIFDLDGLLIDSEPAWDEADATFLAAHSIQLTAALREQVLGLGAKEGIELFKTVGLQGDTQDLIIERRSYFLDAFLQNPALMKGARQIVTTVKKLGFSVAIATGGHTVSTVEKILKILDMAGVFDAVLSSDEVLHGKPAPDVFLEAAKRLDTSPADCVVFEDAPNGVLAAKAAGMTAIGINSDSELREKLGEAGADGVYQNLVEVEHVFS